MFTPDFIWRMSPYPGLEGKGGLIASGRWHSRPKPIVYCSDESLTAYCEILRQIGHVSLMPEGYKLIKIKCPSNVEFQEILEESLDQEWNSDTIGFKYCRPIGDEWLKSGKTALLKVPSAARTGNFNYLINPSAYRAHELTVAEVFEQPFPTSLVL